jgi:hypothetical protein
MEEIVSFNVEAMRISEIMDIIDDLGMGFGCWLGEWDDGYRHREAGDRFYIDIYPTNEYVDWNDECEPWGHAYGNSFEMVLRMAFTDAIAGLNRWIERQAELKAEEEEDDNG